MQLPVQGTCSDDHTLAAERSAAAEARVLILTGNVPVEDSTLFWGNQGNPLVGTTLGIDLAQLSVDAPRGHDMVSLNTIGLSDTHRIFRESGIAGKERDAAGA